MEGLSRRLNWAGIAGCAGVATGSILVYAYILMYYIRDRGFRGGGYLKAEGEGVFGSGRQSLKSF